MDKVYFTKDIKSIGAHLPTDFVKGSVVVYHSMYDRPDIEPAEFIEWEKYRGKYNDLGADKIILVGLNRMINPANRCDFVHEYLTTLTPNIPKIVIDTAPFIGEPWRLFFHYLFTNTNKFGYNYSYPIEGEWSKWFLYESNDCRLSADNLKMFITGTYSDLAQLNNEFSFIDPTIEQSEWYEQMKGHVFSKYNTPKMWINQLLSESNKKFGLKFSFESYLKGGCHQVPDLGIYRFVVEENKRRQAIYNVFAV